MGDPSGQLTCTLTCDDGYQFYGHAKSLVYTCKEGEEFTTPGLHTYVSDCISELHINLWDVFFDPELCMWLSDLKTFSVRILRMLIQAMLVVSVKSENVRHSAGHLC